MKKDEKELAIAHLIWYLIIICIVGVLAYTMFKPMDEDTREMVVYNIGPNRTDDCTFITYEKDIFWTDVFMACNVSTLPNKMNNYTLRYVSDYKKHYITNKSNRSISTWCHDITGEHSYTPCSKIFAYRKYF